MDLIMAKVAIITNVLPSYRSDFYHKLHNRLASNLTIYCQSRIPGLNLKTIHEEFKGCVRLVRSVSVSRERISFQFLPFWELISGYDIYFFYGNPRVVSNVLMATLLRALGKKVVIWGQLHTAGANKFYERARMLWWRTFKYIFLYTDSSAMRLRNGAFKTQCVIGMNNGLNQELIESKKSEWNAATLAEWKINHQLNGHTLLLSCARLEAKNNFQLMLDAMTKMVEQTSSILWCVIGDGPERDALQARAETMALTPYIRWLGPIYDESELAPWFLSASILIHPGAIGLSLLHAYGYGLPVITHDNDEQHMPEIAAMAASNQALRFIENDSADLAEKVQLALASKEILAEIAKAALLITRFQYNTNVMVERFCSVVTAAGLNLPPAPASAGYIS